MTQWTRRRFLQWAATLAASTMLLGPGCATKPDEDAARRPARPLRDGEAYLAVSRGSDPATITERAIAALGGIEAAVKSAGGVMEMMNPAKFVETPIPNGVDIKKWNIYRDIMTADVLINIPIAKHHSLARLSLGMKNLLGVITKPGNIHSNLGQRTADLASAVRPTLTIVDAVRTLMAHGPTGGSLSDVRQTDTIIASHDMVAADAWAATLFDLRGADIAYIKAAAAMGLGTLDLGSINVEEIDV